MEWYPRYGDAFIGGTIGLTLEEIGAYTLILDAIYCRNNHLPDDFKLICKLLRCDPRKARRLRQRLLDLGKLETADGFLRNPRATRELAMAQLRMDIGRKLGQSSAKKRRKINSATPTTPQDTLTKIHIESLLPSSLTTSERLQPSAELLAHETKRRPTPGSLATAPFDSALARPAFANTVAKEPSSKVFTPAEVGKSTAWDWEEKRATNEDRFYALPNTAQLLAWEQFTGSVSRDPTGGCWFPQEWPPTMRNAMAAN